MWLDSRAGVERAELEAANRAAGLGARRAAPPHSVQRAEPAAAARTRWYLNSWEALALRLSGGAASTIVPGASAISRDALARTDLDLEKVAPGIETGTVLGGLTSEAARHLGIAAGTPVVAGLVDAFALPGAGDGAGARIASASRGRVRGLADRRSPFTGGFTTSGPLPGLNSSVRDGRDRSALAGSPGVLGGSVAFRAPRGGRDRRSWRRGLVSHIPRRRTLALGTSVRARSCLTLGHHEPPDRAILEAAALAIRHVAQPMLDAGLAVTAMRACGGPAADDGWNQIKADVTGFTVEVPRARETAAVGAAIVAAVGVGAHPDLPAAIRAMTVIDRRSAPSPHRSAISTGSSRPTRLYPRSHRFPAGR